MTALIPNSFHLGGDICKMIVFSVFVLLFFASTTVGSTCPQNFDQVPREDTCLSTFGAAKNYFDADRQCRSLNALSAKIENVYENSFIFSLLPRTTNGTDPFIGVEKKPDGTWTYADGSPLRYQNWASGEPQQLSNTSICATMSASDGRWKAAECNVARPFACSINNGDPIGDCPKDWINFQGNCYYLQDFILQTNNQWILYDFNDAEQNCRELGAHLVSIHSQEEDDFLFNLAFFNSANASAVIQDPCSSGYAAPWIGFSGYVSDQSRSQWTDGSPVDYLSYAVDNSGRSYKWKITNDQSCNKKAWVNSDVGQAARFICKMQSSREKRRAQKAEQREQTFVCPNGFDQFPDENICSVSINKTVFYVDAIRQCAAINAMPVKIQNIYENNYLYALLTTELNGIGPYVGVEKKPNGTWEYADGSPLVYQNWDAENNQSAGDCVMMNPTNGRWKVVSCSYSKPFICSTNEYVNHCPFGWSYLASANSCYYLQDFAFYKFNNTLILYTAGVAESNCKAMGSNVHLASIHSREELDFVFGLSYSNVKNFSTSVTTLNLCAIPSVWIGMLANTKEPVIASWTDGSPFDYLGYPLNALTPSTYQWAIRNDRSCNYRDLMYYGQTDLTARYICKMPSLRDK